MPYLTLENGTGYLRGETNTGSLLLETLHTLAALCQRLHHRLGLGT